MTDVNKILKMETRAKSLEPYNYPLEDILLEEENDNFIYAIREEIIDMVMLEIEKIDQKERIVTFIVDIACEALWRMMNIEFLHHAQIPDVNLPNWSGDTWSEPSPRDFLAAKTVPIKVNKDLEIKLRESVPELICHCLPKAKEPCECLLPNEQRNLKNLEILNRPPTPRFVDSDQFLVEKTRKDTVDKSCTDEVSSEICDNHVLQSLPSLVEADSEDSVLQKDVRCVMSEGFSKIRNAINQITLPKIDVSKPTRVTKVNCVVELPDVRTCVTHEFQSDDDEKKEKARKKKEAERNAKLRKTM